MESDNSWLKSLAVRFLFPSHPGPYRILPVIVIDHTPNRTRIALAYAQRCSHTHTHTCSALKRRGYYYTIYFSFHKKMFFSRNVLIHLILKLNTESRKWRAPIERYIVAVSFMISSQCTQQSEFDFEGETETRWGIAAILHVNTLSVLPSSIASSSTIPTPIYPYHFQFTWQIWWGRRRGMAERLSRFAAPAAPVLKCIGRDMNGWLWDGEWQCQRSGVTGCNCYFSRGFVGWKEREGGGGVMLAKVKNLGN